MIRAVHARKARDSFWSQRDLHPTDPFFRDFSRGSLPRHPSGAHAPPGDGVRRPLRSRHVTSKQTSLALVAVVVLAGAWLAFRTRDEPRRSSATPDAGEVDDPEAPMQALAPPLPAAAAAPPPAPSIDPAKRDAMRELIYKAFGQAPPPASRPARDTYVLPEHGPMWTGTEIPGDTETNPGIEPEYIRDSVRGQFFPVANKCYGDALATNPKLAGEIVLWFVIVGDKSVGGIVESVDVLNKSTLRDPDVIECLRESFLGVTFPPPKGGGAVTVEYPILFSNDDDGGD